MPSPRNLRAAAAAALAVLATAAAGAGAAAIATTPPSTPTPTPAPTPGPTPAPQQICIDPAPAQANRPAALQVSPSADGTRARLEWEPANGPALGGPCYEAPVTWDIAVDGQPAGTASAIFEGNFTVTGLTPGETHTFSVKARTGPLSVPDRTLAIRPGVCADARPDAGSTRPEVNTPTFELVDGQLAARLRWTAPSVYCPITSYRIFESSVAPVDQPASAGTGALLTGITGTGQQSASVVATDEAGNVWRSWLTSFNVPPGPKPTPTPSPTPTPTPTSQRSTIFGISGSLGLRGSGGAGTFAVAGSGGGLIPLSGNGSVSIRVGELTSSGTFTAAGLLPVKATLKTSAGFITGSLTAGKLTATTSRTITIGKATLYGVTLTQNDACKTAAPVTIPLTSTGQFTASSGGQLTGQFIAGKFTGCGTLGSLLSTTSTRSNLTLNLGVFVS